MARRRYVWDPKLKELVEVSADYVQPRPEAPNIFGDIEPFRSTVDGTVISSRSKLREHNKRNNVTFTEDFKGEWAEARRKREAEFQARNVDRREAIREALERGRR